MTLCLQHTVAGIYEGSNFLDQLITLSEFTCLWSKNAIYCQRSSGFVCREKAMNADNLCIFRLCLEQVHEKRTAINGHKAAVLKISKAHWKTSARGNVNHLQEKKQVERSVWIRFEGWASHDQNAWLGGFFSQDFRQHDFMTELSSTLMA